ncbi:serine hydrolase [Planococcus lenghuensis]|uniref:Uncharacterized protein n=1 Tax=Planococcus lenghuensis TaxID=2213202 RepID=A0A1Q2L4K8_9BACL|nr:serine hydrolase [Planococcus lenghuensis]AQQ54802.1 hypothetical protein B0X71_17970 [Planococcus lenghuensis]
MCRGKENNELDAELEAWCNKENVPGMALIAMQNGERIFEKYAGFRNVEQRLPVTPDTVFGVASITKSLTALAIMQLVDENKLAVEDPVVKWLPEFRLPDQAHDTAITIHHLLTHTSGLPGMEAVHRARAVSIIEDPDGAELFDNPAPLEKVLTVETVEDVMDVVADTEFRLLAPPGELFNYSNEGYALLQEIIERAGGKPYIAYVQERILNPLGMDRSVFRTEELQTMTDVTELYAYRKKREVFHSPAWWDVGRIYSNGSLKASAADLVKYAELFRRSGLAGSERIISEAGMRRMTAPHVWLPTGAAYGYGLQIDPEPEFRLFGHGGSIKGVSSHMKIAPEAGMTLVVLMNIADAPAGDIAMRTLRRLLGLPDAGPPPEDVLESERLEMYAGRYESAEGQRAEVTLQEGTLRVQAGQESYPLRPYDEHGFVTPGGDRLKFLTDDRGDITALFKGVRVLPKITQDCHGKMERKTVR